MEAKREVLKFWDFAVRITADATSANKVLAEVTRRMKAMSGSTIVGRTWRRSWSLATV
jgi:hypothetical protein